MDLADDGFINIHHDKLNCVLVNNENGEVHERVINNKLKIILLSTTQPRTQFHQTIRSVKPNLGYLI